MLTFTFIIAACAFMATVHLSVPPNKKCVAKTPAPNTLNADAKPFVPGSSLPQPQQVVVPKLDKVTKLAIQLSTFEPFTEEFDALTTHSMDTVNEHQQQMWASVLGKVSEMVSVESRSIALCKSVLFLERVIDTHYYAYLKDGKACNLVFFDTLRSALRLARVQDFVRDIFNGLSPDTKVFLVRLWAARKLHAIKTAIQPRPPKDQFEPITILESALEWPNAKWRSLQLSSSKLQLLTFNAYKLVRQEKSEYEPVLGACYAMCLVYNVRFARKIEMSVEAWKKFLAIFGNMIPFLDQRLVNAAIWIGYNEVQGLANHHF